MNKLQIKAEVLATLRAISGSTMPDPSLLTDLKLIEDKKAVIDILIRELVNADEHRSLIICWLLTELVDKEQLNNELWDVIKSPEYNDHIKMIAFNMLKDLGNKIDYEVISGYFEKFNELINKETKELLDTAIMNPEAQIDFMDFLNALSDNDKILLIRSLEEDYAHDALANIVIPVFLFYMETEVGDAALEILGKTKSQLAYHALENVKQYVNEAQQAKINKALSSLKLSGIRVDNTVDFYKEILKESKPYKSYVSFPDGHGNIAVIFSRIRPNKTLQFLALVVNPRYGILDSFGFNAMQERDFYKIIDKFYNYQEKYEVKPEIVKYLALQAVESSYANDEPIPYEYICWESILLDIEAERPEVNLDKKELNQKEIDKLCLSDYVQNWFYDEITSPEFKEFIDKLSREFKSNNFNVDLDKFVADNFDSIYTAKELAYQMVNFNIAAYLRLLKDDKDLAQTLYSLGTNYAFLTNILRKSIYEYYVGQRYILKNQRKAATMFEQKLQPQADDFELLQLDMIISSIEAKWVE
ncbi:MAG: hypothetical protein NC408_06170 [Candidatus Gastranaerophilales bacterium]|nr:hypothetical protein [Candidatus Gastranaerophilales bacterium]MCM1072827.1 hypothetical protein [Bacteroides sp.]